MLLIVLFWPTHAVPIVRLHTTVGPYHICGRGLLPFTRRLRLENQLIRFFSLSASFVFLVCTVFFRRSFLASSESSVKSGCRACLVMISQTTRAVVYAKPSLMALSTIRKLADLATRESSVYRRETPPAPEKLPPAYWFRRGVVYRQASADNARRVASRR